MDDDEYAKLFRRMNPPGFSSLLYLFLHIFVNNISALHLYSCVTDRVVIDNNASDDATVIQVSFQSILIYIYIYTHTFLSYLFLHVCLFVFSSYNRLIV